MHRRWTVPPRQKLPHDLEMGRAPIVPYISYRDADAGLRFLREAFGFEVSLRWADEDGSVQHAEVNWSGATVMLGTAEHATLDLIERSTGLGLYLVVDDVDEHFERAVAAGAEVVFPPEDTEWGTRRFRVRDPEGYEWSFGNYRPGES